MLDQELLDILVCPETKQPVSLADDDLLAQLNAAIREGSVTNRSGVTLTEALEAGLLRDDRAVVYPVRDGIPIMLIDEAVPLEGLSASSRSGG